MVLARLNKKERSVDLSCFSRGSSRKKGQNMTLGTIIAIVLGIAVLVFLVYGFATGWGNLWSRITAYSGGDANVDTIKQACALACASNAENDYCLRERTITFSGDEERVGSCYNYKDRLGVSCSMTCPPDKVYKQTCSDLGGEWVKECGTSEKKPITSFSEDRSDADKKNPDKAKCCSKI